MKTFKYILFIILTFNVLNGFAQAGKTPVSEMTREQVLNLTQDELLALPFEDLIILSQKLGMSIDELLKMKTTVASKSALTPRETPGIISIITDEEIKNMGARDLIDVLRTVPGINFAYDDAGIVGIQMRGNWAFEGKVLMVIDGQEFNDLKYNMFAFGRHFDVNQIKRIEIIRGPGSAIYGGNAELGVINIITYSGEDLKKVLVSTSYGQMEKSLGHKELSFAAGTKIKDWDISLKTFLNNGNRTDQIYDYDYVYNLSEEGAGIETFNLNFGIKNKNFGFRLIYDNYAPSYVWDSATSKQYFKTLAGEIKYDFHISDKLVITPKFNYRQSIPYYEEGWYQNNLIKRYTGNVIARYDPNNSISITAGIEHFNDVGTMIEKTDSSIFENGESEISYNTSSLFLEGIFKTSFLNFIVGGRIDNHSEFGSAFAPRIGLTKVLDNLHFKLLYSGAFHSPSVGNLLFNPDIKPEKSSVLEFETGYKINNNMFITANIFNIWIKDPIIWYSIGDSLYNYKNEDKTGTLGFELEYRLKYNWGYATLNYSYNQENINTVWDYDIPNENFYIGAIKNKITLNSGFYIFKNICFSPSVIYLDKSYFDPDEELSSDNTVDGRILANCYLNITNMRVGLFSFDWGFGVYDIFNQKYPFIQSYRGFQKPYPGPTREIVARFTVNFGK